MDKKYDTSSPKRKAPRSNRGGCAKKEEVLSPSGESALLFLRKARQAALCGIISVSVNFLSIEGISQLLDTVMFIKQEINPDVIIEGIVLTMLDARTSYARGMVSLIGNTYGNSLPIFNAQIPYSVRASEISALGCSIYAHNAKGKVARAYEKLVQEVIGHGI